MNLQKINDLTNIAQALRNLGSADCGTIDRVVELIGKELDAAEPNAQAEEIQALQASNNIKQANLNLLARKVLVVAENGRIISDEGREMVAMANGLIQEEQLLGLPESFGGPAGTGKSFNCAAAIDPVAQVVDNLKNARAEVLRLIELRKKTSNQDEEVAEAQNEACKAVLSFKEELIKAIDASLKE